MFLLSQSKSSVSEFHQIVFFSNHMHVSSKPIKSECLRISSFFFQKYMHVSSKPIKSKCLRNSSFFFQIICTFLLSQSKVSVSEFHQVIFQIICTFLLSLSKVGVSEFHIFFNFFQSKPSVPQFLKSSLSLIPPKMTDSIQRQIRTSRRRRHSVVKTWPQDWQTKNFHYSTISVLNIALCEKQLPGTGANNQFIVQFQFFFSPSIFKY